MARTLEEVLKVWEARRPGENIRQYFGGKRPAPVPTGPVFPGAVNALNPFGPQDPNNRNFSPFDPIPAVAGFPLEATPTPQVPTGSDWNAGVPRLSQGFGDNLFGTPRKQQKGFGYGQSFEGGNSDIFGQAPSSRFKTY